MKSTSAAHLRWWPVLCIFALAIAAFGCSSTTAEDGPEDEGGSAYDGGSLSDDGWSEDGEVENLLESGRQRDEKSVKLAQVFVSQGRRNMERGNLDAALSNYSDALDLDPTNTDAREGFNEVTAMLGREPGSSGMALDSAVDTKLLQIQEARIRADNAYKRGQLEYEQGNYEAAIRHFEETLAIMQFFPYDLETGFEKGLVRDYITRSEERLEEEREARETELAARVEAEREAEAERAESNLRERIDRLFDEMQAARKKE